MKHYMKFLTPFFLILSLLSCNKGLEGEPSSGLTAADRASGFSSGSSTGGADTTKYKTGVITAGEWHDLDNWSFWKGLDPYLDSTKFMSYWGFNLKQHCALSLTDNSGRKIHNALVTVKDGSTIIWETKTDNAGKAALYVNLFGSFQKNFNVTVSYQGKNFELGSFSNAEQTISAKINSTPIVSKNIDMMLVVDATGSMGDELEYLKVELNDVINRVRANAINDNLRMGSVFYRDKGDEYVTRKLDFTSDNSSLVNFVKNQAAGGGGDFPEAVDEALDVALQQSWRDDAIARILFLVLDAPPHAEYQDMKERLEKITRLASKKGIKIIPIVASGINKETEFLMRFMAMGTNGTYVFITNHSGIGGPHLQPTIGSYKVEFLNDLMVRLMLKYTAL
jgi:von Willebrand factor type A domain